VECEVNDRIHFRITVFSDVKPCALVVRYQPLRETCCSHPHGEQIPKEHRYVSTKLHGVTLENTVTFILKFQGFIWIRIGTSGGILWRILE
jgi:hypothetical protein